MDLPRDLEHLVIFTGLYALRWGAVELNSHVPGCLHTDLYSDIVPRHAHFL